MHEFRRKLMIKSWIGILNLIAVIVTARLACVSLLRDVNGSSHVWFTVIAIVVLIVLTKSVTKTLYWIWMGVYARDHLIHESNERTEPTTMLTLFIYLGVGFAWTLIFWAGAERASSFAIVIDLYFGFILFVAMAFALFRRWSTFRAIRDIERTMHVRFF